MKQKELRCKGNEKWRRSGEQMVLVMETARDSEQRQRVVNKIELS